MTNDLNHSQDPIFSIKADLEAAGIKPNRLKGQNFLISPSTRDKIAILASELDCPNALEIGPGTGILTYALVKIKSRVLALELEPEMVKLLENRFRQFKGFTVLETDALAYLRKSCSIPDASASRGPTCLVSNLPYSISSPVLMFMAEHSEIYPEGILLLQREVVDRVVAKPGDAQRGALSVLIQQQFATRRAFNVKPSHFHPKPKVDSAILVLKKLTQKKVVKVKWNQFRRFVHTCFSQRRKTIFNNLRTQLHIDLVEQLLVETGIEKNIRPQNLPGCAFWEMFEKLEVLKNVK